MKTALLVREPSSSEGPELSKVLYIGHLPHGFYEKQLQGFFSQFGDVKRLKVSRNKKTGRAKHYAFVEFRSPQVAAIAAEAMNGYMMFTQKLDCHVLAASDVHKDLFKGTSRGFKKIPWAKIEQTRHNKPRTVKEQAERVARALSRDKKRKMRLEAAAIDYEYRPLSSMLEAKEEDSNSGKPKATALKASKKKKIAEVGGIGPEVSTLRVSKKKKIAEAGSIEPEASALKVSKKKKRADTGSVEPDVAVAKAFKKKKKRADIAE